MIDQGEFYVSMMIRQGKDGFKWELMVVYGPAKHEHSRRFLEEFQTKCPNAEHPLVIGGDSNLIRRAKDKSTDNID